MGKDSLLGANPCLKLESFSFHPLSAQISWLGFLVSQMEAPLVSQTPAYTVLIL